MSRRCLGLFTVFLMLAPAVLRADEAFDKRFIKDAAQYSIAENEIDRLPPDHSDSDGVRHYAELALGGQKKLLDELRDVAAHHKYEIPSEMTDKQRDTRDRLRSLKGDDFDVEYMGGQVQDLSAMVDLFEQAAKTCEDPNLRDFAARKLDMLHEHRANADELYKKVKEKKR